MEDYEMEKFSVGNWKLAIVYLIFSTNFTPMAFAGNTPAPGSATMTVDNEFLNCSSVNDPSRKYQIKGMGVPESYVFDRKKLTFVYCANVDTQKCDFNSCKSEIEKYDEVAILLPNSYGLQCQNFKDLLGTKKNKNSLTLVTVMANQASRDTLKNELTTFAGTFTGDNAVKGFLPESQNEPFQSTIALYNAGHNRSGDVTCDFGSQIDDPSSSTDNSLLNNFSRTSVLFVSVSFIILMVISLAWLVFYYVQRFRYAHAKDRLARRLFNAAKKALTKIPAKTLRQGDRELDSDCPVCIEPYHASDVIRILPCKHVFHKTCVDPWLLEHRTCPMCKMDILKAFGYNFGHSEESVRDADQLSAGGQSTDGRGVGFPVPLPTDSDLHDPFFPSPAPSPSLLQPVLHSNNTQSFSIIPLTVHNSGARGSDSSADSSDHWVSERHSAEVHRGPINDNNSSSGSEDGHEMRTVTQPLFRPSRSSATAAGSASSAPTAIVVRSSRNGKRRRKSTKSAAANTNVVVASSSSSSSSSSANNHNNHNTNNNGKNIIINRPRSASSQNLGSSIVDPPTPDGRISCGGLRNEAAPSLESL